MVDEEVLQEGRDGEDQRQSIAVAHQGPAPVSRHRLPVDERSIAGAV